MQLSLASAVAALSLGRMPPTQGPPHAYGQKLNRVLREGATPITFPEVATVDGDVHSLTSNAVAAEPTGTSWNRARGDAVDRAVDAGEWWVHSLSLSRNGVFAQFPAPGTAAA